VRLSKSTFMEEEVY